MNIMDRYNVKDGCKVEFLGWQMVKVEIPVQEENEIMKVEMSIAMAEKLGFIERKKMTGWERVEPGGTYYTIGSEAIVDLIDNEPHNTRFHYRANYFSTEEKAEEIQSYQILYRKIRRFADEENAKSGVTGLFHCLKFTTYPELKIVITLETSMRDFEKIYFYTREGGQKAMDKYGDALKKYYNEYMKKTITEVLSKRSIYDCLK